MTSLAPGNFTSPDQIDLFVTNTDSTASKVPIQLADQLVSEKLHKGFFHFRHDIEMPPCLQAAPKDQTLSRPLKRLDPELERLENVTNSEEIYDPLLAFAARATSSFPRRLRTLETSRHRARLSRSYSKFSYASLRNPYSLSSLGYPTTAPPSSISANSPNGRYLDNKPFDHAISALTFRASRVRHDRKLLYVDPFPEIGGKAKDIPHFDFFDNALAAATTLPRYQTIRSK